MIDYNTIRSGDVIYPDYDLRALIYSQYGEYASRSYVVLDRGTTIGRTKKWVKVVNTVLDDGTELEEKVSSGEEYEAPRPLLLVKGDGKVKKATLDWADIKRFRPSKRVKEAMTREPRKHREIIERSVASQQALNKAQDILSSLGVDISACSL